ncbi:hypothetical protein C1645_783729, partial [Glomus cerebriforme]
MYFIIILNPFIIYFPLILLFRPVEQAYFISFETSLFFPLNHALYFIFFHERKVHKNPIRYFITNTNHKHNQKLSSFFFVIELKKKIKINL